MVALPDSCLLACYQDFVIESSFTPNVSDNGQHGYLPRSEPGWYRKRFSVPAEGDGCGVFNPGSFPVDFSFFAYTPGNGHIEPCRLP